jgi:hypothetical protein
MKYIIMAGGKYDKFTTPKQLLKVNDEVIIERTIRLLKENDIQDISISTDNPAFNYLKIPILNHDNSYEVIDGKLYGHWVDAFYPTNEPTCYIFGDVYFSEEAIKTIIKTETKDIELFGSMPPLANNYIKNHIEPFALKVVNTNHLKESIKKTKELYKEGKFWRFPIMWELWTVIKDVPLQTKPDEYIYNYTAINDYTCDIDNKDDVIKLENYLKLGGEFKMVKVKALREFTYGNFDKIVNLVRNDINNNQHGRLYEKDTFECTEEMAKYLTGGCGYDLVKVIEVIPEEVPVVENVEEKIEEIKESAKEQVEEEKPKKVKKSKKK